MTRKGVFPTTRVNQMLKKGHYSKIVSKSAGVFMAGVIEYLVAELCDAAGTVCM